MTQQNREPHNLFVIELARSLLFNADGNLDVRGPLVDLAGGAKEARACVHRVAAELVEGRGLHPERPFRDVNALEVALLFAATGTPCKTGGDELDDRVLVVTADEGPWRGQTWTFWLPLEAGQRS